MDGQLTNLTLMLGITVRQVRVNPEEWQAFTRLQHAGQIKRVHARGETVEEATGELQEHVLEICEEAGWPPPR